MQKMKNWVMAFRPKTLTACLVPVLVATALVKGLGSAPNMQVFTLTLLASFFIQIGTNLVNDAVDFKKGADTEKRIGPQRVTQSGLFTYKQVMIAAGLCFALAVACGVPLVIQGGMPILAVGIFSVLMGYAYTGGPFPLAYLGLGELFVILFFGIIAVMGVYFLHTDGGWGTVSFWPGLQVGFHATVLIAINNLRDAEGDRLVHKNTLAVRMGKNFSRYEIAFFVFAPFAMNAVWWQTGFKWAALLPFVALPLAILLVKNIFKNEPSAIFNKFLGQGALLHLLFGILLSIGFLIS